MSYGAECWRDMLAGKVPVEASDSPKKEGTPKAEEDKENKKDHQFRWVERGTGTVRLLRHPETKAHRIVVRQKAVRAGCPNGEEKRWNILNIYELPETSSATVRRT